MSDVSVKLDELAVRTTSPDGRIGARLRNHRNVSIAFRPGSFRDYYDEKPLAAQLAALLNSLWSAHRTATRDLLTAAGGSPIDAADHWDAGQRRYFTGIETQANTGISTGRVVKVRSTGKTNFEFRLKPGVLAAMGESQFAAEVNSALTDWTANRQRGTAALADEHLELDRPAAAAVHTPR